MEAVGIEPRPSMTNLAEPAASEQLKPVGGGSKPMNLVMMAAIVHGHVCPIVIDAEYKFTAPG